VAIHGHYHIALQGTAASRPATPGYDLLYYATDTGQVSVYDTVGAAWNNIGFSGLALPVTIAQGGTGQTTQTAAFNALDPLTTKGDLIVHDGTNSVRVGVGTNGQEIVADSSDAEGLVWRTTTCFVTGDQSTSSTTPVDIPGLSIAIAASRNYAFDIHLITDSSSAPETNYFSVNGPASPTNIAYTAEAFQPGATAKRSDRQTSYDASHGLTSGSPSTAYAAMIRGVIENGANAGNFVARYWTETGGAEFARVRRGSWMRVWEIP
jgi:hypothetical protein